MTLTTLQEQLSDFLSEPDELGLQLFFILNDQDDLDVVEPALDAGELEPKLRADFIRQLTVEFLQSSEEDQLELEDLNTAEATDRKTIYRIALKDIPKAKKLFAVVMKEEDVDDYDAGKHKFDDIWGIIIKIAKGNEVLYIFKRNYTVNIVKRGFAYPLFFSQGSLKIENRELLKISPKFELILFGKNLFILNRTEFEKSFDYLIAVEEKANAVIDLIIGSKLVEDATKLYDLSKKTNAVKKIIAITHDNPVFKKTPRQIVNFAKKYGYTFSLTEDKSRISLNNQTEARNLLKLFNDDLLLSELSSAKYDSRGKKKIDF